MRKWNWGLIALLFLMVLFWWVVLKKTVLGAESSGTMETVIVWEKGKPAVEFWVNMENYKQKVWDNRPGPMAEESKIILYPQERVKGHADFRERE